VCVGVWVGGGGRLLRTCMCEWVWVGECGCGCVGACEWLFVFVFVQICLQGGYYCVICGTPCMAAYLGCFCKRFPLYTCSDKLYTRAYVYNTSIDDGFVHIVKYTVLSKEL